MPSDADDFPTFLRAREQAAAAFLDGDAKPLNAVVADELAVTFFEPGGAVLVGSEAVRERFHDHAERFSNGTYSFETLHSEVCGSVAYIVGIQRGTVRIAGRANVSTLNLRVTEIFRHENGVWKLVHRHADAVAG